MFKLPKCGFCNSSGTEIQFIKSKGSEDVRAATVCQSCGSILAVSDYEAIAALIQATAKERSEMLKRLTRLEKQLEEFSLPQTMH